MKKFEQISKRHYHIKLGEDYEEVIKNWPEDDEKNG